MNISSEMHQQYLKDFIHSLQSGSEDGNDKLQSHSRSLSVSSLNPNAAEFVPSYMKINDNDDHDDDPWLSSTTTLVNNVTDGDGLHVNNEDAQSRVQRHLFYLMNQLGKQNLPLAEMHFSVTPNGQGINVQFMPQACGNRYPLDENLCMSAGLRMNVVDFRLQSTQFGHDLAALFLNRMFEVLNVKTEEQQLCPKCTTMPRRASFTELEIERQIEDIKGFERLINEDADTRYQEAFKELCHKLGLTDTNRVQVLESTAAADPLPYNDDEEPYEWDSFTEDYGAIKVHNYSTTIGTKGAEHSKELPNKRKLPELRKQDKPSISKPNAPPTTPVRASSTSNVSSIYPKLYKINQSKWSGSSGVRVVKPIKDSKAHRWHNSSPGLAAIGMAIGTGPTPSGSPKKTTDGSHVKENRLNHFDMRTKQPKSGKISHISEMTATKIPKPNAICKVEAPQVSKPSRAATTSRSTAMGQAQGNRNSPSGAQRVLTPRSTHTSQMRQTEVKRRLNLMRGENESDVQVNEYLFK